MKANTIGLFLTTAQQLWTEKSLKTSSSHRCWPYIGPREGFLASLQKRGETWGAGPGAGIPKELRVDLPAGSPRCDLSRAFLQPAFSRERTVPRCSPAPDSVGNSRHAFRAFPAPGRVLAQGRFPSDEFSLPRVLLLILDISTWVAPGARPRDRIYPKNPTSRLLSSPRPRLNATRFPLGNVPARMCRRYLCCAIAEKQSRNTQWKLICLW